MTGALRETVIRIKLQEMEESVDLVREHLPDTVNAFLDLGIVRDGIYKRIEYAIENVFDICAILNTDLKLGVPGADEDLLEHLLQHGVISSAMQQRLKAMKGFRKIVVHRYGKINNALAFSILQEHLGDFSLFRQEIERFLLSVEENAIF